MEKVFVCASGGSLKIVRKIKHEQIGRLFTFFNCSLINLKKTAKILASKQKEKKNENNGK